MLCTLPCDLRALCVVRSAGGASLGVLQAAGSIGYVRTADVVCGWWPIMRRRRERPAVPRAPMNVLECSC